MPEPFKPAISTLLDTDLYKFTMWQVMLHHNPEATGMTQFICRNKPQYPLSALVDGVREQLEYLCSLHFTEHDLGLLGTRAYIKKDFLEWLGIFRFQMKFLEIAADGDELRIIARGPLVHITAFEIFVLSIVNELYFRRLATPAVLTEGRRRLAAKVEHLKSYMVSRRPSAQPRLAESHKLAPCSWPGRPVRAAARQMPSKSPSKRRSDRA